MPLSPASLHRNSLFTHMLVAVVSIALLSIFASISGWRLADSITLTQETLSHKTIPVISAAQSMATQSAAIALIIPGLVLLEEQQRLDESFDRLEQHMRLMESIQKRISQLSDQSIVIREIGQVLNEIRLDLVGYRNIHASKLSLQSNRNIKKARAVDEAKTLNQMLDREIRLLSDDIFENSSHMSQVSDNDAIRLKAGKLIELNLKNEVLHEIKQSGVVLLSLLESIGHSRKQTELRKLKASLDFHMRALVSQSIALPKSTRIIEVNKQLNSLYLLINATDSITDTQLALYDKELELVEIDNHMQGNVFNLNRLTKTLVDKVDANTQAVTQRATESANKGRNILLLVASISLLISIFVIWFVIVRKIILPLNELTGTVRKLSNNQLDFEIREYPFVELNEVSRAIEVSRKNAIALDQYQKNLQENNLVLSRVNDDLSTFVHVASHDLKSPLRGIQVLSEFIIEDIRAGNQTEAEDNLHILQDRISRLNNLLDSLLAYTRLGSSAADFEQVNIVELLEETFDLVNIANRFELRISDSMLVCKIVKSDLTIIFLNLFDNAVAHHDKETGVVSIEIKEQEKFYIFEIEDDGPGIDPQYHTQVFEVLQTLKSKDEVEGSGVGLAQVRRLLELRGGSINLVSNPDISRGSRFIVHYPKLGIE